MRARTSLNLLEALCLRKLFTMAANRQKYAIKQQASGTGFVGFGSSRGGATMDSVFAVPFRKTNKKDSTTKTKGLAELKELFETEDEAVVMSALPTWVTTYNKLWMDNDRRVRMALNATFVALLGTVRKNFALHLKEVIGPWLCSMCDPAGEVATAAEDAFNTAFPSKPRRSIYEFSFDAILDFLTRMLDHTSKSLNGTIVGNFTKTEAEERYERVIVSTVVALTSLVDELSENEDLRVQLAALLDQAFWERGLKSKSAAFRAAWYDAFATTCERMPEAVERSLDFVAPVILGAFGDKSLHSQPAMWSAVLTFMKLFPQAWELVNARKAVLPRLWAFMRSGGYGAGPGGFAGYLPLLSLIPADVKGEGTVFYELFFEHMWTGLETKPGPGVALALVSAWLECVQFLAVRSEDSAVREFSVRGLLLPRLADHLTARELPCGAREHAAALGAVVAGVLRRGADNPELVDGVSAAILELVINTAKQLRSGAAGVETTDSSNNGDDDGEGAVELVSFETFGNRLAAFIGALKSSASAAAGGDANTSRTGSGGNVSSFVGELGTGVIASLLSVIESGAGTGATYTVFGKLCGVCGPAAVDAAAGGSVRMTTRLLQPLSVAAAQAAEAAVQSKGASGAANNPDSGDENSEDGSGNGGDGGDGGDGAAAASGSTPAAVKAASPEVKFASLARAVGVSCGSAAIYADSPETAESRLAEWDAAIAAVLPVGPVYALGLLSVCELGSHLACPSLTSGFESLCSQTLALPVSSSLARKHDAEAAVQFCTRCITGGCVTAGSLAAAGTTAVSFLTALTADSSTPVPTHRARDVPPPASLSLVEALLGSELVGEDLHAELVAAVAALASLDTIERPPTGSSVDAAAALASVPFAGPDRDGESYAELGDDYAEAAAKLWATLSSSQQQQQQQVGGVAATVRGVVAARLANTSSYLDAKRLADFVCETDAEADDSSTLSAALSEVLGALEAGVDWTALAAADGSESGKADSADSLLESLLVPVRALSLYVALLKNLSVEAILSAAGGEGGEAGDSVAAVVTPLRAALGLHSLAKHVLAWAVPLTAQALALIDSKVSPHVLVTPEGSDELSEFGTAVATELLACVTAEPGSVDPPGLLTAAWAVTRLEGTPFLRDLLLSVTYPGGSAGGESSSTIPVRYISSLAIMGLYGGDWGVAPVVPIAEAAVEALERVTVKASHAELAVIFDLCGEVCRSGSIAGAALIKRTVTSLASHAALYQDDVLAEFPTSLLVGLARCTLAAAGSVEPSDALALCPGAASVAEAVLDRVFSTATDGVFADSTSVSGLYAGLRLCLRLNSINSATKSGAGGAGGDSGDNTAAPTPASEFLARVCPRIVVELLLPMGGRPELPSKVELAVQRVLRLLLRGIDGSVIRGTATYDEAVGLLSSPSVEIQKAAYDLIGVHVFADTLERAEVLQARDEALAQKADVSEIEDAAASATADILPAALVAVVSRLPETPVNELAGDEAAIAHEIGYLLAWLCVIDHFSDCHPDQREALNTAIAELDCVDSFISYLFTHIAVNHDPSVGTYSVSELEQPAYGTKSSTELADLAAYMYGRVLRALPRSARGWLEGLDKSTTASIVSYTTTHISPTIIREEIRDVMAAPEILQSDCLSIRAIPNGRQVTALYSKDEIELELTLQFPDSYPLKVVAVSSFDSTGVKDGTGTRRILALENTLHNKDGSVVHALMGWAAHVEKKYDNLEPCPICYYVIHISNKSTPRMACKTCKHKFHSNCLYKWFTSSQQSTCPLCRTPF